MGVNAVNADGEVRSALDVAESLGVNDGSIGAGIFGDYSLAVDDHIICDCGAEGVAGVADL